MQSGRVRDPCCSCQSPACRPGPSYCLVCLGHALPGLLVILMQVCSSVLHLPVDEGTKHAANNATGEDCVRRRDCAQPSLHCTRALAHALHLVCIGVPLRAAALV
jgi:hypothetical protein